MCNFANIFNHNIFNMSMKHISYLFVILFLVCLFSCLSNVSDKSSKAWIQEKLSRARMLIHEIDEAITGNGDMTGLTLREIREKQGYAYTYETKCFL